MYNGHKVVITQTSWKKRIDVLPLSIYIFLTKQTVKPDMFYLWLSEDEFPNRENDLPEVLVQLIKQLNVQLIWLPGNERVYKRWHIYPEHYSDYVISIDDDCIYSTTLIEDILKQFDKYPNSACNIWKQFSAIPTYNHDIQIKFKFSKNEIDERIWACGNIAFPPNTFPLDAISYSALADARKYALSNDEVWLITYLVKHDIKLTCIPKLTQFKVFNYTQQSALNIKNGKTIDQLGYAEGEKMLYHMLNSVKVMSKYKKIHPDYDTSYYDRLSALFTTSQQKGIIIK